LTDPKHGKPVVSITPGAHIHMSPAILVFAALMLGADAVVPDAFFELPYNVEGQQLEAAAVVPDASFDQSPQIYIDPQDVVFVGDDDVTVFLV
jgi:hypothetical protein